MGIEQGKDSAHRQEWAPAWLFMRVSGLILVIMVLVHFTIMHVINDIQDISFAFVVKRFATPFWISFDLIMLILGLVHGLNGMRTIIDDFVRLEVA